VGHNLLSRLIIVPRNRFSRAQNKRVRQEFYSSYLTNVRSFFGLKSSSFSRPVNFLVHKAMMKVFSLFLVPQTLCFRSGKFESKTYKCGKGHAFLDHTTPIKSEGRDIAIKNLNQIAKSPKLRLSAMCYDTPSVTPIEGFLFG